MSKILLIQSYLGRREKPVYPIGLACLAGALDGHEVEVVDPNIEDKPLACVKKRLQEFAPDVVGLSLRNIDTTQFRDPYVYYTAFVEQVRMLKKLRPEARLVAGGSGFSMFAEQIMSENPEIDTGVQFEGEGAFVELVAHLDEPGCVKGVYYRRGSEIMFSGERPFADYNVLPRPRHDLAGPGRYAEFRDGVGVQTKRGCLLDCAYCSYGFLNGHKVRLRPPEDIVDELTELRDKHGVTDFTFIDSVFNVPSDHALAICREMIKRDCGMTWSAWFTEHGFDQETLDLARAAGCREFSFSPDAITDRSLKVLHKPVKWADIDRVYRLLRGVDGIKVSYNFFANPPGQTLGGFLRLMWFYIRARLQLGDRWGGFLLGRIRVEPHTEIHRQALQAGAVKEGDNLLATNRKELVRLFFSEPRGRVVEAAYRLYCFLWRLKHRDI